MRWYGCLIASGILCFPGCQNDDHLGSFLECKSIEQSGPETTVWIVNLSAEPVSSWTLHWKGCKVINKNTKSEYAQDASQTSGTEIIGGQPQMLWSTRWPGEIALESLEHLVSQHPAAAKHED